MVSLGKYENGNMRFWPICISETARSLIRGFLFPSFRPGRTGAGLSILYRRKPVRPPLLRHGGHKTQRRAQAQMKQRLRAFESAIAAGGRQRTHKLTAETLVRDRTL